MSEITAENCRLIPACDARGLTVAEMPHGRSVLAWVGSLLGFLSMGITILTASPALAGNQHARARVCRFAGCLVVNTYKPHNGFAKALAPASLGAYMYAEAKTNHYTGGGWWPTNKGFYGNWHADHHSGSGLRATPNFDGERRTHKPGEPGHASSATLVVVAGTDPNTVDVTLEPASYLQLDLSEPETRDLPYRTTWTITIAGEYSVVGLIASPQGDSFVVKPVVEGLFVGRELTVKAVEGDRYILQLASPLKWTVRGDVKELDIGIEGQFCIGSCAPTRDPSLRTDAPKSWWNNWVRQFHRWLGRIGFYGLGSSALAA